MNQSKATISVVKKRDGRLAPFERKKIEDAIFAAATAVGGDDRAPAEKLTDEVLAELNKSFSRKDPPSIDDIQDLVERVLIKNSHVKTAKAYILYRKQHDLLRADHGTFLSVNKTMDEYLRQTDWRVFENSNSDYSFSGLMSHLAGKLIANYMLNQVYPSTISQAHQNGELHIHDLGYGVVGYCAGWSLKNLLITGFGGPSKKIRSKPPKHLEVVVIQMVNFMGTLQMEHAGAQAFSSVDTLLAPFVKSDKLNYKEVKQNLQMLIFSLNVPSRWSCQAPFTNFTFDWTVPDDMKDEKPYVGGKEMDFTYGDCQKEMDMINRAFIEVMLDGDADGRTFFYPIPTYNITRDFNWEDENAKKLFEMTAKYGTPYFQNFINSSLKPSDVRSMCCRLQLDLKELRNKMGGFFGAGDQTGSVGVVTINLPRIGYMAKDEADYFRYLDRLLNLAKDSLEIKRALVEKNLQNGLMPFTKVYLGTYKQHFSTLGINGMHESMLNFLGKDKGIHTKEGRAFALKVIHHIREKMTRFQEETGNLYNLEATPCESATYRFAKKDKALFPDIITAGSPEKPYYTNSTQLPVDHTDDIFDALDHQDELQCLYTGGTVLHGFLGERVSDWKAAASLVKKIAYGYKLPYFTITPTFSIDPVHGYIPGEHRFSPYEFTEAELDTYGVEVDDQGKIIADKNIKNMIKGGVKDDKKGAV
ncbi:MAG: ribonucleoside triphosphate reductase [DPANN group archaeon]|nr:ribonucleoside triphosphate reductase [DPANN group archaeon]